METSAVSLLKTAIAEKDIRPLYDAAKSYKSFPVIIPSYKLRNNKGCTMSCLDQIGRKIYIVVYDFDFYESGYDKLELPANAEFVILKDHPADMPVPSLDYKMYRIHKFVVENNIPGWFKLDDDMILKQTITVLADSCRSSTGKTIVRPNIGIDQMYDLMEMTALSGMYPDWGCVQIPLGGRTALLGHNFQNHWRKSWSSSGGMYLVNGELSKAACEDFNPKKTYGAHEFAVIVGLAMKHGFTPYMECRCSMTHMLAKFVGSTMGNGTAINWNNRMLKTSAFFADSIKPTFKLSPDGEYWLNFQFRNYIIGKITADYRLIDKIRQEFVGLKTSQEQFACVKKYFPDVTVRVQKSSE